jgi:Tol biopolymer transport system component
MATEVWTQEIQVHSKRRNVVLLGLALGAALASVVSSGSVAHRAEAASTEKFVFESNRTTGTGVDNPTGDYEIFKMNTDGLSVTQLTYNTANDLEPRLSPDGTKIAYRSEGIQTSNPEGDSDIYVMNALDGSGKKNLSNNGLDVDDYVPAFSPDGKKIAYTSQGKQTSNPEGDFDVYRVNIFDVTRKKNLTNNGGGVDDYDPAFSPDGAKIAYQSKGMQTSNPQGDFEVYRMNTLDGSGKKNLSNNDGVHDYRPVFSPDGAKIADESYGTPSSNPEGDLEVYRINALDGTGKKNLSNNGLYVDDYQPVFSAEGTKIAYTSHGAQTSNPEGDSDIYVMNALGGTGAQNLSNSADGIYDSDPAFSSDGAKVSYVSHGVQNSNPDGDFEVYRMNVLDGSGQTNLTNNPATDGVYLREIR